MPGDGLARPSYVADLHLDDIVRAATAGHEGTELERVFDEPLRDLDAITDRHDVFRDLEDGVLLEAVRTFGRDMDLVHRRLEHASRSTYATDRERWLLSSAEAYIGAVIALRDRLRDAHLGSQSLATVRADLATYLDSAEFTSLSADTQRVRVAIESVAYRLRIHDSKVTVTRFQPEPDYSAEVLASFETFRQGGARKRHEWRFDQSSDMNHVEAAILERVARLQPEPFEALHTYAERHRSFVDPLIARFDREVRFYVAWIDVMARVRRDSDLRFCYPSVSHGSGGVEAVGIFDLALAISLVGEGRVVPNDVDVGPGERIVLVSGPNQGGKTTFGRAIGQLHHLARIGVPVPGERVSLPLVDGIFTHFERQEQVEDLTSKLEDDLRRIQAILDQATSESLIVMNESFTSTTVDDQLVIGRRVLRQILDRGPICVMVTFLDDLVALDPAIVSMVAGVDPADDTRRTFEVVRRPPDGLAYALAIAEKHRLTYRSVTERLAR